MKCLLAVAAAFSLALSSAQGQAIRVFDRLDKLLDVSIASPTSGQLLRYNGTKWENATISTGGVTSVGVSGANGIGVSGSPITSSGTISLSLGAITPTSVTSSGAVTGSNLSGTNTGDQTITLTGDVTGSGTGSFAATIANNSVTLAKMADMATASFLGRNTASTGDPEVLSIATAKTMLNLSGTNTGDQTSVTGNAGTATALQTPRTINGTSFDGTANITVTAAAGTLTGTTLASNVTASSLTSAAGGSFGTAAYTASSAYQASDSDLTTWAGITPATGIGTFLATPNSANLATALTDENFVLGGKVIFSPGTLNVTSGKTLASTNTLTFSGTDSSTLNIGSGGTLGSAAYTASGDYATAGQGAKADAAIPNTYLDTDVDLTADSDTKIATQKATKAYVDAHSGGSPYLVYVALLNQSGMDAPVATVLQNTLGGTPAWSYYGTGVYSAELTSAFPAGKTVCFIATPGRNGWSGSSTTFHVFTAERFTSDVIGIQTLSHTDDGVYGEDGRLVDTPIEIRVYP